MKRINFNIKDRKILALGLCLILVCVFTLTIAYAALNAVLTIQGSAEVSSANWDIYLDNPRVTPGSKTINVPEIKTSSTLEFSTTLNMPGDFYEFTVDVVNDGSIDAMIENVVKTPELTADQASFLKYEITYQNGEAISNKQTLAKETSMPIKVRIEYRKDLSNTDLPTSQVVLDLSLTLEYIQSDGSGSNVVDSGVDLYAVGLEKCFGSECFYIISSDEDNVTLLAKYNLNVGGTASDLLNAVPYESPTGLQDINSQGYKLDENGREVLPWEGVIEFSNDTKKGENYSSYNGSVVEEKVNSYVAYLESQSVDVVSSRLITFDELISFGCSSSVNPPCKNAPTWLYSSSYWTMSPTAGSMSDRQLYAVVDGGVVAGNVYFQYIVGVRPVIVVPKEYLN